MSFESFYGGRMGASFIIVKRFNDINIEEDSEYAFKYYACTADGNSFLSKNNSLIEKNNKNYRDYRWKPHTLDGTTITTKDVDSETEVDITLDIVYAEGMVQCFSKGGETTDEVNYGEYVIIDTLNKNNPNNGKVYRRGMNYIYDAINNPLAGAEYIGQIVGPQGNSPELSIDHYETIIAGSEELVNIQTFIYDESNLDIMPGFIDGNYNDTIELVSANIQDEYGNIYGCVIGFKLPTLVQDFEARSMSPYLQRAVDPDTGKYYNYDLISEDENQFVDGKWIHPFYQKWQIKIPQGYHGVNSTNIEIIHSKTMPAGYKDDFAGTPVYVDSDCTNAMIVDGQPLVLTSSVAIRKEEENTIYLPTDTPIYDTNDAVISCSIEYNDQIRYVRKEDCYMDIVRYREVNFDNSEAGEITYHYIGDYNTIKRITLAEDGTLTVFYNAIEQPQDINQKITWIDDVSLSQQGDFIVLFNNDNVDNGRYRTTLNWIDYVTVGNDGTMTFYYNSNHNVPAYKFNKLIEVVSDLKIQTENPANAGEGTGDQKLHVEFNTGRLEVIGNPLNYIIETVISRPSTAYPNAPYSHLLVYYADPALRQTLASKWVTYPSEKESGVVRTEWVDLGDVRGAAGGLHILEDVDDLSKLQSGGVWIPPEQLTDSGGVIINPDGAGWAVTYTQTGSTVVIIYCYDYNSKIWYPIGSIDPSAIQPRSIIVKSTPVGDTQLPDDVDVSILKEDGFWFASETMYFAN